MNYEVYLCYFTAIYISGMPTVYIWFHRSHAPVLIIQCHTVQNYTFPERSRNTCALSGTTSIWIQITCKLQMFDDALLSVVNWFKYIPNTLHT